MVLRQRILARHGDDLISFQAVLQKQGDRMTLLGLTDFGTRAFLIEQRGLVVQFQRFVPRDLPFAPEYILMDIQRTFFPFLDGDPPFEGVRSGVRDGEQVVERWSGGRLMERTFSRPHARPSAAIRVSYEGGMEPGQVPDMIRLENGRFGYSLSI